MPVGKPSRPFALAESLLAAFIWSSSFIWIAFGVQEISPLTLAGLRYTLAGALLLPFLLHGSASILRLPGQVWQRLLLMGLLMHTLGNGAIYLAVPYLSPTLMTLYTCMMPVPVLLLGIVQLREIPRAIQLFGLLITLLGSALVFSPSANPGAWVGLGLAAWGLCSFSFGIVQGRVLAKTQAANTLTLTSIPLVSGGLPLLVIAYFWEGSPSVSFFAWEVIVVLALLNTIVAYIFYNHSMQTLTVLEANIFLNLSPLGAAVLSWYFFEERLTLLQILGMLLVVAGVTLVQWRQSEAPTKLTARASSDSKLYGQ